MSNENDIAVILIHGIGDLERRDVLNAASNGIRRSFPDICLADSSETPARHAGESKGRAYVSTVGLKWKESRVRLVEYYWSQIPGKIRARNPLRAFAQALGTLSEFPRMSTNASSSPWLRQLAAFCGRFQQALVLFALVLAVITVVEGIRNAPDTDLLRAFDTLYAAAERDLQGIATTKDTDNVKTALGCLWANNPAFVTLVFLIPFVTGTWFLMLVGCIAFPVASVFRPRRWNQFNALWRTATVSALLMIFAIWVIELLAQGILIGVNDVAAARLIQHPQMEDGILVTTILVLMSLAFAKAGLITANLLRDVVHYLATDAHGNPLTTQQTIQDELWKVIEQLRHEAGFRNIVVVAHSLGTVILVDLLRSRTKGTRSADRIQLDIVTAGSPLRRLIYRFLPNRLPAPATIYSELAHASTIRVVRWFNVYRILDYVGQALNSRADPPGGIIDRPLRPRLRLPLGHANYWGDPRFLNFVATEVIAPYRNRPN